MRFQAHRGVSTEYPENTLPAFRAALEQGYAYIETDPHFTADGQCVLLHDCDLNRTCRLADGSPLPEKVTIEHISYAEALQYDAGIALAPEFRGTKIPLLSQLLDLTRDTVAVVKIDNRFQGFTPEQKEAMFAIIRESGAKVAVTCSNLDTVRLVRQRLPECEIHYDGYVDEEYVRACRELVGSGEFYVWLGLDRPQISWVKVPKASPALCAMVKKYAHLGIWILSTPEELTDAAALGADLIETTGSLKPDGSYRPGKGM